MGSDGRFVLYQNGIETWSAGEAIDCDDLTSVLRFADGELSLYQSCGCDAAPFGYLDIAGTTPVWNWKILVDTSGHLVLEDDGNWAIFNSEMDAIWSIGLSNRECCELGVEYSCTPTCPSFAECWVERPPPPECENGTDHPCDPPTPEPGCDGGCECTDDCVVTCDDLDPTSTEY